MKKIKDILLVWGFAIGAASCANEAPFVGPAEQKGMGQINKESILLDIRSEQNLKTKAENIHYEVNPEDFLIVFQKSKGSNPPVWVTNKSALFKDLPDVVALPAGTYKIAANFRHENASLAAWEAPVYEGEVGEFNIVPNEITSNIGSLKCYLKNVKVSVVFDPILAARMSDESYVEVKVSNNEAFLNFTKSEERHGYFELGDAHTLAATFHGNIDGSDIVEVKTLDNVDTGNHYQLTFKVHDYKNENTPSLDGEVNVDASVTVTNIDTSVKNPEEDLLDDTERPNEGDDDNPDDPIPPTGDGPTVTAYAPLNLAEVNMVSDLKILDDTGQPILDAEGNETYSCILNVHSDTGIQDFSVKIDSETLTKDILVGVGLSTEFNMITGMTPEKNDVTEGLSGLGLPVGDQVKNQNDVVFDISQFMGLLGIYGAANHKFILTIKDASGTSVVELKLKTE